jgi:YD repeat-containing protein
MGLWYLTAEFDIDYDAVGRRASVAFPNGITSNFTYDDASRLTNLDHKNALNVILESLGYTYDATGNRIGMDRQNVSLPQRAAATGIAYNSANQMLTFSDKNMTYDANGNMTSLTNTCGTTNYT